MADLLDRYRDKRDFAATPEPKGKPAKPGKALAYVIQKHAARQLHYDFRLELDGTLKSWAIPKGPSLDPSDKRMAVHVEDHPPAYGGFEGVIPPKQYGAGTVIVWDRGTWEPIGDARAGYRAGKLKFKLRGEKLQGGWTLVRMRGRADERQEPWLLIKERDATARPASQFSVVDKLPDSVLSGLPLPAAEMRKAKPEKVAKTAASRSKKTRKAPSSKMPAGAKPAKLPLTLAPQLATLVDSAPPGDDWIYEIKFDGYRVLARIDGEDVRIFTRNGHDWTAKLRSLAQAIKRLNIASAWIDGEIVVFDAHGAAQFNALQNAFDSARTDAIHYFVFDLPFCDGHDLRDVSLIERRALLRERVQGSPSQRIRFSEAFKASPAQILRNACEMRLEGVIGKRIDAPYVSRRSPDWIKLKRTHRQEFVIAGYTDPQGARTGIGALLLGIHDEAGKLRFAGSVGTGFDTKTLAALKAKLTPLTVEQTLLFEKPREARGHWVKPKLIAEISFAEWTKDRRVRHAVFHGLRTDKPAAQIKKEEPANPANIAKAGAAQPKRGKAAPEESVSDVRISNPDRIIDPATGIRKIDLVNYYLLAAKRMLPRLAGRPVALVRAPSGIDHQLFFQKHGDATKFPHLKQLDPSLDPGHSPMLGIDSFAALIGAAQMNVVEFHTWNATTKSIERPNRMTFDLDPGEGVAWPMMLEAAELTHRLLDELGLRSFLKTSGGKGLHIVVPLTPRDDWETVKNFSNTIVEHLAQTLPGHFVAKSGAKNRVGKIFVDYLRNGRGATTAAAFSARARPGLGVSIPCAWDELSALTGGAQWTINNARERLESGEQAWADYASIRQTLTAAKKTLGAR